MSEEGRKGVFRCEYSEQNPVYCQQCGGHEHLCKKPLSDRWCEYANHLIVHGNDITALSMRTNLLAEMKALAATPANPVREAATALVAKHIEVAEADVFEMNFGDGTMMIGMSPKDIYQIGYAAALFGLGPELTALKAELDKEQR